ncbi:hypothetical protein OGCDGJMD_01926 [Cyanobium usitatum str. Tous]|jgi:hypothetical protein|uniref:hypothetical protein n=1 Tax=Cyanobium usitatum TaxID=2304190 RepID=UPI002AD51559|nr:hypothetical protein [Cyanobium usitatum]CAK6695873.1 hypothetical protein OGCDGJMD_01926 [Cyanobium usitatum str. Tous]
MDQKLIGTAFLAALAAALLDADSAAFLRDLVGPWLRSPLLVPLAGALPQLQTGAGILCLVAIPIMWLRPR